jgi:hypothetical protein
LYQTVEVSDIMVGATYSQVRTPNRDYYLHVSHGSEMPFTEMEVQGTREECEGCAILVHTGSRRYLVVVPGVVNCTGGSQAWVTHNLERGAVIVLSRGDVCKNLRMVISEEGRHIARYIVSAAGANPLDSLVLRRREQTDQFDVSHSVTDSHAALNIHLRQNLGMAQQDIENLINETQESFKLYSVTSTGTMSWLAIISLLALLLVILIVRKCCQHAKDRGDDTVFIPPTMPVGTRRPVPLPPLTPPPASSSVFCPMYIIYCAQIRLTFAVFNFRVAPILVDFILH